MDMLLPLRENTGPSVKSSSVTVSLLSRASSSFTDVAGRLSCDRSVRCIWSLAHRMNEGLVRSK